MKIIIDQQFQEFMKLNELDLGLILEKSGIPNLLWREKLELNNEQFFQFQEELSKVLTDEQILLLSDVQNIGLFIPLFFMALASSNGLQAIERLSKYKKIIAPINIIVKVERDEVIISIADLHSKNNLSRFGLLNEQLLLLSILKTGSGSNIIPKRVITPYKTNKNIIDFLGIEPEISDEANKIIFSLDDLEIPFSTRNNSMWKYLEPELNRKLSEIESPVLFINHLHKELKSAIPSGNYSIEKMSNSLGVSVRTLQRNLANSGTTFKAELQLIQKQMAIQFSLNPILTTDEISYMVGYTETSSFTRAFKKWTGMTLNEYRKKDMIAKNNN